MNENGPSNRFARLLDVVASVLRPIAPLATRLAVGQAFVLTGLGKWQNFDRTADFFGSLGIPAARANAAFVATLEVVGGACLVLGFGTRIFALLLMATLAVALMTADRADFVSALAWRPPENRSVLDIAASAYFLFLLWLAAFGAGSISLDHRLFRRTEPGS